MLIQLADTKSFLRKAVLIACLGSAILQSTSVLADTLVEPSSPVLDASYVIDSSSIKSGVYFKATSMRGESVQFVDANDPGVKIIRDDMPGLAFSDKRITDLGEMACVVAKDTPFQSRLSEQGLHYGPYADGGFVTNPSLARIVTANHEIGHCLDFYASKDLLKKQAELGIGMPTMGGMSVANAVASHDGVIDYDYSLGLSREEFMDDIEQARTYRDIGVSITEAYADLSGALQTASHTEDLRGFTDFEMIFRLSPDAKTTHSTTLSVANLLQKEIDGGFNPASLKGASADIISEITNEMFIRHFGVNGKISIHSDGFKDIVKTIQIKESLGSNLDDATKNAIDRLVEITGASPNDTDKVFYTQLLSHSVSFQQNLVDTSENSQEKADAQKIVDGYIAQFEKAKIEFGIKNQESSPTFLNNNKDINDNSLRSIARSPNFYSISKESSGVKTDFSEINDLLAQNEKIFNDNSASLSL